MLDIFKDKNFIHKTQIHILYSLMLVQITLLVFDIVTFDYFS